MNRVVGIEFIRLISVIFVILFHLDPNRFQSGYLGVDIFFILSGYFSALHLFSSKKTNIFKYFLKRLIRILPGLVTISLFTIIVLTTIGLPFEIKVVTKSIPFAITGTSNYYFWKQLDYFEFFENFQPLLHTWSTSVELQFFLLISILCAITHYNINIILLIFFIGGLICFGYLFVLESFDRPGAYFVAFFRFWEFGCGIAIAKLAQLNRFSIPSFYSNYGGGTIIISLVLYFSFYQTTINYFSFSYFVFIFFAMVSIYLGLMVSEKKINNKVDISIIYFAKFTYPIFLVHYPFIQVINIFYDELSGREIALLISCFFGITYIIYWLTDYQYFRRNIKGLVSITLAQLFILTTLIPFTVNLNLAMPWMTEPKSKALSDLYFYNIKDFKSYVVGDYEKQLLAKNLSNQILLIGDSYSQDFFNILNKSNIVQKNEIKLFYTPAECGVFTTIISNDDSKCGVNKHELISGLKDAQYIILANYWNKSNLRPIYNKNFDWSLFENKDILFIHEKSLQMPSVRKLIELSNHGEVSVSLPGKNFEIAKDKEKIIDNLSNVAKSFSTFNFYQKYSNCANCMLVLNGLGLLTLDGQHLTEIGTTYFARKFRETTFSNLLKDRN